MNTDTAFRIGKAHSVCQDYGMTGSGNSKFVLLSDGCSSSPDTDVGARLIVRSAANILLKNTIDFIQPVGPSLAEYHQKVIGAARSFVEPLGLHPHSLDATLLTLQAVEGRWIASISGDGTLAMQDGDGVIHLRTISYTRSYPFYLNYSGDVDRLEALGRQTDNLRLMERSVLRPDGRVEVQETVTELAQTEPYCETGKVEDFQWIAILSDGVGSFVRVDDSGAHEPVPLNTVLRELLAFKNFNGVFVERRMQRFLRDCT
nr:protein phosphatase 2C domain-containing protein [Armatimonadota bacterium]